MPVVIGCNKINLLGALKTQQVQTFPQNFVGCFDILIPTE